MRIVDTKSNYNKRYNQANNSFPVRLGILQEIIQEKAFESDQSRHWVILDALEKCFWPDVIERAKGIATFYYEVVSLIKRDLTLKEALEEMKINEKLFIIGLTDLQARNLASLLEPGEAEKFKRKKGYYNYVGEHNKACEPSMFKIFRGTKKKFSSNDSQLSFFY